MTTVELHFLANRYHATAWGRHVNEGAGEWPPSPYRLLRALYDAWKRKCPEIPESDVRTLFVALAEQPPTFYLPPAISGHTRSYLNSNTEDSSKKALIFDGFVSLPRESRCFLEWDLDLMPDQRRTLQSLLSTVNYLGRSEAWVEARLASSAQRDRAWRPAAWEDQHGTVPVACAVPASEYKLRQPAWLDALAYSSGAILKQKLSGPPAMRFVPYSVPEDALTTWLPVRKAGKARHISAAILELSAKVLPGIGDTVRVAERIRGRLMRHFETKNQGQIPWMVHGKDEDGVPRKDHRQLFILPRANDKGRIDQVLIYTHHPDGFLDGIGDAITGIHKIRWIEEIRCVASWMGRFDDLKVRPLAKSVESTTPFVTVRHFRKGRHESIQEFLIDEVKRECRNHKLADVERVTPILFDSFRFRRSREGDSSHPGYGFRIEFKEPVQTPFSLGYGCHFGLGQFG